VHNAKPAPVAAPAWTAARVVSPFPLGGVQRAVKVGAPGDAAEHEAERAADHVVSGPAHKAPVISRIESLQRQVNRIREQGPAAEGAVHRAEAEVHKASQPAESVHRAGTEEGAVHRAEAEVHKASQPAESVHRAGTAEGAVHRAEAEVHKASQPAESVHRAGMEEGAVHRAEAEVHKASQPAESVHRAGTAEGAVHRAEAEVHKSSQPTESVHRAAVERKPPAAVQRAGTEAVQRCCCVEEERPSGTASIYRKVKDEPVSGEPVRRKTASDMDTAAAHAVSTKGAGEPLRPHVRQTLEKRMGVDLRGVRVHEGPAAHQSAAAINARAFTHKTDIWLGRGESQDNVRLMAHEVTHVVQQGGATRRAPVIHRPHEEEPVRREAVPVNENVSSPRVQRLGFGTVLDYIADHANLIPGFRMFTIVLGVNPINMSPVERSAANVLRAVVELIPGGALITQALDAYGVFDKVGTWVDQQLATLNLVGSSIKQALTDFIKSLGLSDLADLGGAWDRAKRIFTEPIDRIKNFVAGLADGIIKFIKDAILMPLAKLAEGTKGWDLLIAVLGKNPITGEAVPRTAETLIGGFMKLIGQEEVWENIKKSNAISRAWAWFQSALGALLGFVSQIPTLFMQAVKSLELVDIVVITRAFAKVGAVFGKFIGDFLKWAGDAVWQLLQIIFEVLAPGAIPYLKKLGAAFKTVLKNPIAFVGNLVKAAKLGFQQFANNIGAHLKASFIEWLTGSLQGVYIPKSLEFKEIVTFALSVLGLTWQNIRQKLVKATSETVVKAMETGFSLVVTLVKEGPAAAWEQIKEQLSSLKDMVMQGIMDFVIETVVKKAVARVLSLLVPGGAFIQAIISIYDTIMVFIDKLAKIIQVAKAFLDSMMEIASGAIAGAANKVETTLAGLLTLALNFLAGFLGLGKIADKVMNIINTKVRQPIDKALDKVISWIVTMAKKLFSKVFGKKDKDGKDQGPPIKLAAPLDMDGEPHTIYTEVRDGKLVVEMGSSQRADLMALTAHAISQTENKTAAKRLGNVQTKLKSAEDMVTHLISDRTKDAEALATADKMTQDAANTLRMIGTEFGITSLLVTPHKSQFVEATVTGYRIKKEFQGSIRDKFYPSSYEPATRAWKQQFIKAHIDKDNPNNFKDVPKGRSEPIAEATIDHQPRVVTHWQDEGKNLTQAARSTWYSDYGSGHLSVIAKKYNSSDGAEARNMGERYLPDNVGKGFLGPGEA
jgi:hypothetical protein